MEAWYRIVKPRIEVREGRSFNPDEFAIALEQVVAGTAPEDYRDPDKFFSRTYFTRALHEHTIEVLRRLAGETTNTAPVLSLITQFGGGKTHTLTTLYHLARAGAAASQFSGINALLHDAKLSAIPQAKVAVFVGNAWDPQPLHETPWLDIARQLAGDQGAAALGAAAATTAPGTDALNRLFQTAGGSVLILLDEVLNFINRHHTMADQFHSFLHNLTVAMTGTTHSAAVISLPRSQTEMTDRDLAWQEKLTKVVRRVGKDLMVLDEAEVSEVIRRRLFEDLGNPETRTQVAKTFADWCFERRDRLPREWTAIDTATKDSHARAFLQERFAACYPFHPATLSVFQRKWQTLPQYQQTRGTLAMLAQWVSLCYRKGFMHAREEPLITLGSAPLDVADLRSIVLGQSGESRLSAAIDADIAGQMAHARALDADTQGALTNIHQRIGTTIFFESSGGVTQKIAYLPEIRFALGEPSIDTTTLDNAARKLLDRAFYIREVSTEGYRIHHKPTLKKVVSDRRSALDAEKEVNPAIRQLVKDEFEKGRTLKIVLFPSNGNDVEDTPKLTLIVLDPVAFSWSQDDVLDNIATWTRERNGATRLYPAALVWCVSQSVYDVRNRVQDWLAWKRVDEEIQKGVLGDDIDADERDEVQREIHQAEAEAREKVWAMYRILVLYDKKAEDKVKVIDLGLGHASRGDTLCGRVIEALKSEALLNDSVAAGHLSGKWPPALQEQGAWPLASLRQCFLDGTLQRLIDPEHVLKTKIQEFVQKGEFGLAAAPQPDGTYAHIWFNETVGLSEITFTSDVYLLRKEVAQKLKEPPPPPPPLIPKPKPEVEDKEKNPDQTAWEIDTEEKQGTKGKQGTEHKDGVDPPPPPETCQLHIAGTIDPNSWNRLGRGLIAKLRDNKELTVRVEFTVTVDTSRADEFKNDIAQALDEMGIADTLCLDEQ